MSENLQTILSSHGIAGEFFFPPSYSSIVKGVYRLGNGNRYVLSPSSGLRVFPEPKVVTNDNYLIDLHDKICTDLGRLVSSIQNLRQHPSYNNAVLSSDSINARDTSGYNGKRVQFGIDMSNDAYLDENKAANICYKNICLAVNRAGFDVTSNHPFEKSEGFASLKSWATNVSYTKRFDRRWFLLLLPLLFLLLVRNCGNEKIGSVLSAAFDVDTNVIIVLDTSESMDCCFDRVREQTTALIEKRLKKPKGVYMDLILFAKEPYPIFGELKKMDSENSKELLDELPRTAQEKTYIMPALEQAAKEIGEFDIAKNAQKKSKKTAKKGIEKTTVILITDGEFTEDPDKGPVQIIPKIIADPTILRKHIGNEELAKEGFIINTIAVRTKDDPYKGSVNNRFHAALRDLSKKFKGRYDVWNFYDDNKTDQQESK
ncbi:MAG: VWA domain-containing protein [Planctomycetaceae bacterium]|jgi:hypothetical protein|nr:VWA domain-containing protein [Planctomycetaceae bacterium]